jgi:hypothetical protein
MSLPEVETLETFPFSLEEGLEGDFETDFNDFGVLAFFGTPPCYPIAAS